MTREQALEVWDRYQRGVFVNPADIDEAIEVSKDAIHQSLRQSDAIGKLNEWQEEGP